MAHYLSIYLGIHWQLYTKKILNQHSKTLINNKIDLKTKTNIYTYVYNVILYNTVRLYKDADINIDAILQMMFFILENDHFVFNGQPYTPITGTEIGSEVSRNYACTYLGV